MKKLKLLYRREDRSQLFLPCKHFMSESDKKKLEEKVRYDW